MPRNSRRVPHTRLKHKHLHLHLHVLHSATMNRLIVWLLLCLTIFSSSTLASILAIDYGAEWIKAVLLAPGQQFDILLDKSSKRKVQSSVGWKRDDRLFGSDALAIVRVFSFVVARTPLLRACMRTCSRSRQSRAFGKCDAHTSFLMTAGAYTVEAPQAMRTSRALAVKSMWFRSAHARRQSYDT